jgi:hypothetical protein
MCLSTLPSRSAFRDLVERLNAAHCDVVDPGARLSFEGRLGLGPMQNSFDRSERWRAQRQADVAQVDDAAALALSEASSNGARAELVPSIRCRSSSMSLNSIWPRDLC